MQQNRNDYREIFFKVWKKCDQQQVITDAMENIINQIIQQHPEYHQTLSNYDKYIDKDYLPESGQSNPFMHMSMHIAITEQLTIDQPLGIKSIYQQLCTKLGDSHAVEHQIMECLGSVMWTAQKNQQTPDMNSYLNCVKRQLN